MFRLSLLIALAVVALGGATALAEDDYVPIFGTGEHTVWDEDAGAFGATYEYHAEPTDSGWYTSIRAEGGYLAVVGYSTLSFVCLYTEETDTVAMYVLFSGHSLPPFMNETVSVMTTVGSNDPLTYDWTRAANNDRNLYLIVSSLARTRQADAVTVQIGPYSLSHYVKGLFDVPVALNLVWCDERD